MDNRINMMIALVVVAAMVLVAPASAETVEVRGEVVDAASQIAPFTWTARNFAGFYYDSDRDLMSEALTTEVAVPDTINAGDLTYNAYRVKCSYTNPEIGEYFAIGWFGTKYMAVNGKPHIISPIILEMDKDDKKTLAVGQEWVLGNGYSLILRQIDLEGDKIWLELARDGAEVTSSVIGPLNGATHGDEFCNRMTISGIPGAYTATVGDVGTTRTFVYQKDVGSENSVPVFSVYVDCIFRGTDTNIVQLKHAILIDEDPISLIGAEVGRLDVGATTSESVRLRNAQSLHLEMDSDIHVAESLWFHVADDLDEDRVENHRYYPYIEHACSSGSVPPPPPPPPPPRDMIFEGELQVNHGIEIEDDVRVEVVQVSTASRGSVTLRISSYQNDAVIVLSEGESTVYRTISDEVIELEAVEVHSGSAWLVITGPADWEVTEYYVVGDYGQVVRIRGEVVELVDEPTGDIVWNASNSALFWYDLNYDLMTETLLLGPPCISQYDRNIEAGCLHYFTSPVYKEYQVYENENLTVDTNTGYHLMGWMGDAYAAIGGDASKLCKLLEEFDGDDKKTLVVGEEWDIDGGFVLVAKQVDLDGNRVWLSLTKGGVEIDSEVVSDGEVYTYTADIGGVVNVPIFTCYVDAVFMGTNTNLVQIRRVFLIDDVVMEIEVGDRYGAMDVAIADVGGLVLTTETSIDLDPGTRKHIMGNMYFETADDGAVVRFYPVAEYREPGVYEVRGTTKELTATNPTPDADMVWDYNTFAGLWYGPDDDLNTETLTIERSALNVETHDRELDEGTVTYKTHPVFQEYDLKPGAGNESGDYGYFVEGWMGDAYAAIGGDAGKLCKLIVASGDEKKILTSGEAWHLGRGFTLVADQINLNGTTANLTLSKYGRVIDSATVSEESVYKYTEDIGGAQDVLIFSCYVDAVFRGTKTELVQVTHVFLIDDVVMEINLGDEYGAMGVVAAPTDEIVLANTEPIDLDAGAQELVMGDMYFVTADDETVIRFYPVVERIIGGDETPADDCIFDCELKVNCGIEIEDDVTIELARVSADRGGSAKLSLSSYQKPETVVTLFMGDTPTGYETGSGETIYIGVTRVYNDSVRLRVTGPADWRITAYYIVSIGAGEVVSIHGEVVELTGAQTADIVWDAYNFAAFHYDLDCDVTTETMRIASGTLSEHDRTIDDESLTYTTEAFDVDFDCGNWGAYRTINLMAESYFTGYGEDLTHDVITAEDFDLISKNMLGMVLIDEDDARMLATGTSLQLKEGYEVKVIQIDIDGGNAQLELLRNGELVETDIVNVPDTFVYKGDLGGLDDVPLIAVYINSIFAGTGVDMVKIDGIFQISEICISVQPGDSYGEMKILADDSSDTISMHNYDPIDLLKGGARGDPIGIGGRIGFTVADNATLRFAPVATMVEPGMYEVRGAVRDVALNQGAEIVWNASNSDFLWYDIDSDASTEVLAIAPGTLHERSRTIDAGTLSYTTQPVYQEYEVYENEGLTVDGQEGYMAEGWMGQQYVAIGGNASKLCKSLLEFGDYDKSVIAAGDAWDLGGGFALAVREIDPAGDRVWFILEKDGIELDTTVVSSGEVCVCRADVGDCEDEKDIPIFSCYVDAIFRGVANMVQVKHVFMIDCDPIEINSSLFDCMQVVTADSRQIVLRNDEMIELGEGTIEHIMDEMYFRIADDASSVRFYPFVERLV